ncbi:unnamed protein product [Rotaria sp. Silwood1]|nr:unnamed protein product [Rotaria sp. Silwood1]CAF1538024.1 unnamed protein product [Rotaria sp. Silwood1]
MINQGRQLCCRYNTDGVPMIGIGYHLTRNDSETIMLMYNLTLSNVLSDCQRNTSKYCLTNDQAEEILNRISYQEATQCANEYVPNLPSMKRNAIIDVAFTSCRTLNTFRKTKKALQMTNWTEAAEELKDSRWCSRIRRRCNKDYNCIRNNGNSLNQFINIL